jgi:hypothetical protein
MLAAGAAVLLALAVGAFLAWENSSIVLVPRHDWHASVDVEAVTPGRIVLGRTDESERRGVYGLVWRGGHAIVGPVLSRDGDTVTRNLRAVDGYLVPGVDADLDTDVYNGDPRTTLGVPFRTVAIHGELGPLPSWLVPGAGGTHGTWAIVVHGLNATRREGLRLVPALRAAGLASLLISYRDDLGAPASPDGLHHLGQTEWRDLEAAVRFARAHGARRLVLIGYSMGGAIIAQFMERSDFAPEASGLVLDAPVLDWRAVLEYNATESGYPAVAANPVEWAIDARVGADWNSLDALAHPQDFRLPILLFQGTEDDSVPIENSDDFAAELGRRVTYYKVARAGHTQAWNVGPVVYDRRLVSFLRRNDLTTPPPSSTKKARPRGSGSTG